MPTRTQFIRDIRKQAAALGLDIVVDTKKGKGNHYRVTAGDRTTTVPERISPLMAKIIRRQLGLD
ncbi:hypothetical protein [Roseibium sp. RKSG952]|uniref:hypothetical protein n=1 Tax=Roseibium sp. RKSG952 TaxID=2529384 RepID=UPI0012BB9E23|nr:hypothetical protein [Roseibium sp. RKSG952]MTH98116.1 hypothetical protein [Roseibium sp. RKSG952]